MKEKTILKLISEYFVNIGFKEKGTSYYINVNNSICVIGIQKSEYSNSCYVNIGYFIQNDKDSYPKHTAGDIRARFSFAYLGTKDLISFDFVNIDLLKKDVEENINNFIKPFLAGESLKSLLERNPILLHQTNLEAKGNWDLNEHTNHIVWGLPGMLRWLNYIQTFIGINVNIFAHLLT